MKIDEAAHMVWGCVTSETPDSDGEICDYPSVKKAIQDWSDETLAKTTAAGQDPSLGNMRVMHQLQVGGKAVKIEFKDEPKQVWVGSEPADEDVWHLLKGGFLTAHSIGGNYLWKKKEGDYTRYAPTIGEISYVDKGSNPDASFSYVKADGSIELRKFQKPGAEEKELLEKIRLSDLDTKIEKVRDELAKFVRETHTGAAMKPEEIKKAAAALGISEAEFSEKFLKAKGMSALHGHIAKAISHHEAMHKAHGEMADMHKAHVGHLGKCMKACKAVMGADDGDEDDAKKAAEAEELKKAEELKADELRKAEEKVASDAAAEALTKSRSETAAFIKAEIEKGIKSIMDKLPADDAAEKARLFVVKRANEGVTSAATNDPLPL